MDFTWQVATGRYRGPDGQFVADGAVRQAVDQVLDASTARVRTLSQRLLQGQTSLAEWQQQFALEIKSLHLATMTVAHGGTVQMSAADYGWAGQRIRTQYQYLHNMAAQIASGQQPLNGTLLARSALYSEAARGTFEAARERDARLRGQDEARRVLSAAEHCAACVAEAARGWQPIGSLASIGSLTCRSRCRCSLVFRLRGQHAA
jgi:hypothetical protein